MGKRTRTIEKRIGKDDPTLIELSRLISKDPTTPLEREKTLLEREETFQGILDKLIDKGVIKDTAKDLADYRQRLTQAAKYA